MNTASAIVAFITAAKPTPRIFVEGLAVFAAALASLIVVAGVTVLIRISISRHRLGFREEWNGSLESRRRLYDQMFGVLEVIAGISFAILIAVVAVNGFAFPYNVILTLSSIAAIIVIRDGARRWFGVTTNGDI